jgi:RNase adaptor protein for sRNA GlmZ degradation
MNTRKTIYDKLFTEKVELAKHEIELGLVDDLKASISKVSSLGLIVNTMSSNADKTNKLFINALAQKEIILKNYNDNRKTFEKLNKELNLLFKTINTQAKDLGININDLPVYKDFIKAKDDIKLLDNKTQSAWTLVSKY